MSEEKYIEEKFKRVYAELLSKKDMDDIKHKEVDEKFQRTFDYLDLILEQTTRTNGKVADLDKKTRLAQFVQSKPLIFVGVIAGIAIAVNMVEFQEIINLLSRIL